MSQENVDAVRRVLEAAGRGDLSDLLSLHDPEWEGFIPAEYPVAGTYRGLDGVRAFVEEWLDAWEEFRVEPEEFLDVGDSVVVMVRYWGRGKGSGVEVHDRWAYLYKLRDGKIIRWRLYASRNEALKAVGLAE
jgi:ketosteroid isomerase-like protein